MGRRKSRYRAALLDLPEFLRSPDRPVEVPAGMPATIEPGMGAGHVLVGRALAEPGRYFVGLEIKEERAYQAARVAAEHGLRNVVFVVGEIARFEGAVPAHRFDEIMILFPDPWPRKRDVPRRLFSPRYLQIFARWMTPGATGILRSDNPVVVEHAEAAIAGFGCAITSVSADAAPGEIQTRYEARFRKEAAKIGEVRFRWPLAAAAPADPHPPPSERFLPLPPRSA
jgi:tRNA (guanine-N7-)-methyltransferase